MSAGGDARLPIRLLLSAYACHPIEGSEPGVGWAFLNAALDACAEVHLLTRANNVASVEAALTGDQRARCHVIGFDLAPIVLKWKKRLRGSAEAYYITWQGKARPLVRRLQTLHRYDLAHHVTFSGDWTNVAVRGVDGLPFVWGPIGGATRTPLALFRYLGVKGAAVDIVRAAIGGTGRAVNGNRSARSAALVVAGNKDVHDRYSSYSRRLVVEPHVAICNDVMHTQSREKRVGPVVGIGRLVPWKGWLLALESIARLNDPSVQFLLFGDGPDRRRLEDRARRLRVADRVEFAGNVPRQDIFSALKSARALLFPSLHDSMPWAVAEALTLGCPVVCLDLGGPPELVARAGGTIVPHAGQDLAGRLADALAAPRAPHDRSVWSSERLPAILKDWYAAATGQVYLSGTEFEIKTAASGDPTTPDIQSLGATVERRMRPDAGDLRWHSDGKERA